MAGPFGSHHANKFELELEVSTPQVRLGDSLKICEKVGRYIFLPSRTEPHNAGLLHARSPLKQMHCGQTGKTVLQSRWPQLSMGSMGSGREGGEGGGVWVGGLIPQILVVPPVAQCWQWRHTACWSRQQSLHETS